MLIQIFWFPLSSAGLTVAAFVIALSIAHHHGHVSSFLSYISDHGVHYPERPIFTQFLDMAAYCGIITMILRYMIIVQISPGGSRIWRLTKGFSLFFGITSTVCLTLVGNFQENLEDKVHYVGAGGTFVGGTLYIAIDTWITFKLRASREKGFCLLCVKFTCAVASVVFCLLFGFGYGLSETQLVATREQHQQWLPENPGYEMHALGVTSEWILAFVFVFYFITLAYELFIYTPTMNIFVQQRIENQANDDEALSTSSLAAPPTDKTLLLGPSALNIRKTASHVKSTIC